MIDFFKKYKHLLRMIPIIQRFLKLFFFFINFFTPIKCERTRQCSTFGCYSFFFGGFHFFSGIFFFRWTQYWVIFLFILPFIYFLKNIGISFSIPTVNLKLPCLDKAIPLSTRILEIFVRSSWQIKRSFVFGYFVHIIVISDTVFAIVNLFLTSCKDIGIKFLFFGFST